MSPEAMLGVVFLLPLLVGLIVAVFYRRTIHKYVAIATVALVLPVGFGLANAFNTIFADALWLGMD